MRREHSGEDAQEAGERERRAQVGRFGQQSDHRRAGEEPAVAEGRDGGSVYQRRKLVHGGELDVQRLPRSGVSIRVGVDITTGVWEAAFWGFVGGFALVVGAGLGLIWRIPPRVVGIVMAFGAGVLISAVAFELVEESFDASGALPVVAGLVAGALTFYVGDLILDKRGAKHRKRSGGQQASGAAGAIVLGAMLDGIPESVAIGASLLGGGGVGVAVVAAVFLSNVPESLSQPPDCARPGTRPGGSSGCGSGWRCCPRRPLLSGTACSAVLRRSRLR